MNKPQAAPLLQRIFAFLWDYLPILGWLLLVMAFGAALGLLVPDFAEKIFGNPFTGQLAGFCLVTLPVTLYFAVQESSNRHASWGKRRRGLVVVTMLGEGVGFMQALARSLLKFVPWELSHTFIIHASIAAKAGQDPPDWAAALLVLAWLLVIANVVSLLMSARRQTLYDRITGTQVMIGVSAGGVGPVRLPNCRASFWRATSAQLILKPPKSFCSKAAKKSWPALRLICPKARSNN